MTMDCPHCHRGLEYSGEPPKFCGYCGRPLAVGSSDATEASGNARTDVALDETVAYPSPKGPNGAPERLAGYRLIRALGQGGMGTVFEAEEEALGRKVALKLVAPEVLTSPDAVERFRQEGRLASAIAHPRCVFVLAADEEQGRPYIVMELMPGRTLADLVRERGPLPPGEAVAKILDAIEGLQEAHRLGLIHRDVKPSNCFLEADGRVKVGDFGLSKSLSTDSNLTRTGAFLGTPLYASPEQIRGEPLDARTDVYSASATLYYLLTGKAPFEQNDAAATMARIVSDPAPSARAARPDVPQALDRVILRGLERDRERRWRNLDELRAALAPFAGRPMSPGRLRLRAAAYLFDVLFLGLVELVVEHFLPRRMAFSLSVEAALWLAYFILMETIWGATLGKMLARVRVAPAGGAGTPGPWAVALRSLVFLPLAEVPLIFFGAYAEIWDWESWPPPSGLGLSLLAELAGVAVMASTMRRVNGLLGLHEVLSRTRVVGLPREGRRRAPSGRRRPIGRDRGAIARPVGVLKAVGPYRVRGAVRWEPGRRVLAGEDSTLGREVWVVIRPKGSPPPGQARRDLARPTRPRWLSGGESPEGRWDAYNAPSGCPLADLAGADGLPWHDARPLIEDMADEASAACADGTLPPGLTVDQVWIELDGRAQLVDPLGNAPAAGAAAPAGESDESRALIFLRRVAALALEGGRRRMDDLPTSIGAPVPLHASDMLDRLLGRGRPYERPAEFRADLLATKDHPTEVGPGQRAIQLGLMALFMLVPLGVLYYFVHGLLTGEFASPDFAADDPLVLRKYWRTCGAIIATGFVLLACVAWAFLTREGLSYRLTGLGLVRRDGRRAGRFRCAWRMFLIGLVPAALLAASAWAADRGLRPAALPMVLFWLSAASMLASAAACFLSPSRGLHDYLAGTHVVPS